MNKINNIRKLTKEEINTICAGEIVTNPYSVVKELVENAIDANASHIKVTLVNGGKDLIEVEDNGVGISPENINIALEKHSTSKFTTLDDIKFLGFRGEALYSIAETSNFQIISSNNNDGIAFDKDGNMCSRNPGTTVIVKDLLYNIPARRKFLKSGQYEYQKVFYLLQEYSIVHPNIQFTLLHNNKIHKYDSHRELIKYTGGSPIDINYEKDCMKVTGYIIKYSEKHKYIIAVNNRVINSFSINKAIQNTYSNISGKSDLSYYINLHINASDIDVNVHPTKREIRIENMDSLLSFIEEAICNALNITTSSQSQTIDDYSYILSDIESQLDTTNITKPQFTQTILDDYEPLVTKLSLNNLEKPNYLYNQADKYISNSVKNKKKSLEEVCKPSKQKLGKVIKQLFYRYIITIHEDDIFIIDQHAAAERILSETLKQSVKISQNMLLEPIILNLPSQSWVEENKQHIDKFFTYKICDEKMIIYSIPQMVPFAIISDFLCKMDFGKINNSILDTFHEYGCKNSLKSSVKLSHQEMEKLVEQIENCNNQQFCNHGRPVYKQLDVNFLDKIFLRTK